MSNVNISPSSRKSSPLNDQNWAKMGVGQSSQVEFVKNEDPVVLYERGLCPVAKRLHFEEIVTTDSCKYPNSEREVEEFVAALKKIKDNIEALKAF